MAWMIGTASDYKDCLDQVRQFTQKAFAAGAITPGGGNTGDGVIYGASASHNSVSETWTITATSATNFTVSGSVSGAQVDATVGTPYSIDEVSFIINDGDAAFVATDSFTFPVAGSTAEWVQDRWDTDYDGSGGYELIQHGIGGGSDEVYVGYNTKTDASTYWNWLITGLTGYVPANDMINQPGYFPYYDCLNNSSSFPFTCIFTSRHIKVMPIIGAVYGGTYAGWILPHATPSQWDYPMFCGGSSDDVGQLLGGTEDEHTLYWNAFSDEKSGAVLDISVWNEINTFNPRHYGDFANFRPTQDDLMLLYPAVPIHEASNNVYGALEGVYYPTPFIPSTGLLTEGDVISTADATALCFRDITRAGAGNIIAMDLMGDL